MGLYPYAFGFDPLYLGIVLISMILGGAAQAYIKSTYAKWSEVAASTSLTGAEVARRMLDTEGASNCSIGRTSGHLSDYFDPRSNSLHLSSENFGEASVAAVAVACHEAGHAVQTAKGYAFFKLRTALLPVVQFAQMSWMYVLIAGFALNMAGLTTLAIWLFGATVLFQLVTLPVEFDASRRALAYIKKTAPGIDAEGARQVLVAAALTYVAAALVSILQLLYLLGRNRRD